MTDSLGRIFSIAASGMNAQSVRLSTIASNLSNAGSSGTEATAYHAKNVIFSEVKKSVSGLNPEDQFLGGVQVTGVVSSTKPLDKRYDPSNPSADENGNVYATDVNPIEEMTNMIAASKEYEANVEVMNTAKTLMAQSINALNTR